MAARGRPDGETSQGYLQWHTSACRTVQQFHELLCDQVVIILSFAKKGMTRGCADRDFETKLCMNFVCM